MTHDHDKNVNEQPESGESTENRKPIDNRGYGKGPGQGQGTAAKEEFTGLGDDHIDRKGNFEEVDKLAEEGGTPGPDDEWSPGSGR